MKQKNNKIDNYGQVDIFGRVYLPEQGDYTDVWLTPIETFNIINKEFKFDLDAATEKNNPLNTPKFFTEEDNSLTKQWDGNVWLNPPYSNIDEWVFKAYTEWKRDRNRFIVMLMPARTDTKYFHKYIAPYAEVRFFKGRLKFSNIGSAPFPSMLIIYGKEANIKTQERV